MCNAPRGRKLPPPSLSSFFILEYLKRINNNAIDGKHTSAVVAGKIDRKSSILRIRRHGFLYDEEYTRGGGVIHNILHW